MKGFGSQLLITRWLLRTYIAYWGLRRQLIRAAWSTLVAHSINPYTCFLSEQTVALPACAGTCNWEKYWRLPGHCLKSSRQSLGFPIVAQCWAQIASIWEPFKHLQPLWWRWLDLHTNNDRKERKKKKRPSRRALINYRSQLHTGLLELRRGTDGSCLNSPAQGWREQAGRGWHWKTEEIPGNYSWTRE